MEVASSAPDRLVETGAEREQLIAALYYYRATLMEAPGDELTIYLIEMMIAELTTGSRTDRSP